MNNFNRTFLALLKELKVNVTRTSALEYLEAHPDYHSMLAYSDALNKWNIENAAIRIEKEQLLEIPVPFITFSRNNGGTFSLIRKFNGGTVERLDTETGWVNENHEKFFANWSGVVMLAELSSESGERNFRERERDVKKNFAKLQIYF